MQAQQQHDDWRQQLRERVRDIRARKGRNGVAKKKRTTKAGGKAKSPKTPAAPAGGLGSIALDLIDPSPYQTRRFTHASSSLQELAESIAALGVLEPVLVRSREAGRFELLAGERRVRAASLAELTEIPAIVRDLDDDQACEVTVTENLQREDLHPLDEASAIELLLQRHGGDVDEVAARIGRPRSFVARRARLNTLTESWRLAIAGDEDLDPDQADSCRICGCTDDEPCEYGCSWVRPGLCSRCPDLSRWGVTHLEIVARMEPSDQDDFLDRIRADRFTRAAHWPTAELERETEAWLRKLSSTPWKLSDAEVLPDTGPCTECPLRASVTPGLFDDVGTGTAKHAVPPGDRCLSASCWDRKLEAHINQQRARLQGETGKPPVLLTEDHRRQDEDGVVYRAWNVKISDEPKRGYTPAVRGDGPEAGRVVYFKQESRSPSTSTAPKKGPLTMKEKRERLRRRRHALAIGYVHEALTASTKVPKLNALLVLAATVGTRTNADFRPGGPWYGDSWRIETKQRKGLPKGTVAELLRAGGACPAPLRELLWMQLLRPVIVNRTKYDSGLDIDVAWAELEAVGGLVGVGVAAFLEKAIEEIPEPKSWSAAA